MVTLSYGYKNPENGDRGSIWFPALNDNIVRLNGHTHDGSNSPLIAATAVTKGTVTTSTWSANGTGSYRQTLTVPSGFNMDDYSISVYDASGIRVLPSIEKLSTTTFRIYTLDNTFVYTVIFR